MAIVVSRVKFRRFELVCAARALPDWHLESYQRDFTDGMLSLVEVVSQRSRFSLCIQTLALLRAMNASVWLVRMCILYLELRQCDVADGM